MQNKSCKWFTAQFTKYIDLNQGRICGAHLANQLVLLKERV